MHAHDPDTESPSEPSASSDELAAALAVVEKNKRERMEACAAEIEQVLAKHGMRLEVPTPQISIVPSP